MTSAGNITLTGPLSMSDGKIVAPNVVTCPIDNLIPSKVLTAQQHTQCPQEDLDAGSVSNVASASIDGETSPTDTVTVNSTHGGGKPTLFPACLSDANTYVRIASPTLME